MLASRIGSFHRSGGACPGTFSAEYLSVFVHGAPDHADYLARIGGEKTRARLSSWRDGPEAWKLLYMDEATA